MGCILRIINYDGDIEIALYKRANSIFKTGEYNETEDVCIHKETINIFNLLKEIQKLKKQLEEYKNKYIKRFEKLGKQIVDIGTFTPSQVREVLQSIKYGNNLDEIMNKISDVSEKNVSDIYKIIEEDKKIEYEQIEELTCNEYDFEKKTINSLIKNQRKLIDEINKLKEDDK